MFTYLVVKRHCQVPSDKRVQAMWRCRVVPETTRTDPAGRRK